MYRYRFNLEIFLNTKYLINLMILYIDGKLSRL